MRAYRYLWIAIGATFAVGAVVGLATLSVAGILALSICFGIFGGYAYSGVRHRAGDQVPSRGQTTGAGVAVAGLAMGAVGLIALLGFSGFLLVVLFAAGSPWCIGRMRKWTAKSDGDGPPTVERRRSQGAPSRERSAPGRGKVAAGRPPIAPPIVPSVPDCASLPDAELCQAWRHSFIVLAKARADERLRVIALRQACLDELQRRDPAGFARWLAAGARAASDPGRFLFTRGAGMQCDGTDAPADHSRPRPSDGG